MVQLRGGSRPQRADQPEILDDGSQVEQDDHEKSGLE
jgi:hypothetical protein